MNNKINLAKVEWVIFVLPAVLLVGIASNIPFIMNFFYSFQKWNGLTKNITFVGFDNYVKLFTSDSSFWGSFGFTFKYLVFYVILVNVLALFFALLLTSNVYFKNIIRSALYMPYVISLIAVSLIWKFIFGPGFSSLHEITGLGVFNLSWLGDSHLVFFSVLLTTLWQTVGFNMVIFIAGITAISPDVLEAASIDGCKGFALLNRIKLPLIMPSITICIFNSITYALKLFDIILVMTKGGPGGASATAAYNIYNEAFINSRYGYGTAKAVIFFLIVFVVTGIQLGFFKGKEVES